MTLRKKTLFLVTVLFLGFMALLPPFLMHFLMPSFDRLEEEAVGQDLRRIQNALGNEVESLSREAVDWAAWDDAYRFMEEPDEVFVESNVGAATLARLRLSALLFMKNSGEMLAGRGYDLDKDEEMPVSPKLLEALSAHRSILLHESPRGGTKGLLLLGEDFVLIATAPILTSREEGPARGTLVMARRFDASEIERLARLTHLSLRMLRYGDAALPMDFVAARRVLDGGAANVIAPDGENSIAAYGLVPDVLGHPAVLIRVDSPRDIHRQGDLAVKVHFCAFGGLLIVLGGLIVFCLERMVLRPLSRFSAAVRDIGSRGDFSRRLRVMGDDELASLGGAIDRMLDALGESQEDLAEGERRYRAVVERSTDGIFLLQPETLSIREANEAFSRMLGYAPGGLEGVSILDITGESPERIEVGIQRIVSKGERLFLEGKFLTRGGAEVSVELFAYTIAVRGCPLICAVVHDLSARRKVEAELKRARDAAEAANRAKSDFLARMSHEIRTPMNAIVGMADLLSETPLDVEQQEYVRVFQAANDVLLHLVNDILDLSKVEAEKVELERVPFRVQDLVERVCGLMAPRAAEKGLAVRGEVAEEIPEVVRGDPVRLRQILLNLIGNSIKFTERGEVSIRVERVEGPGTEGDASDAGSADAEPPVFLHFSVVDSGIGIPPEKIDQVFESFAQADVSTTRKYGGTGLGLPIARKLVQLMGGDITVRSVSGEGSVFSFTVPFERCSELPAEEDAPTAEAIRSKPVPGGGVSFSGLVAGGGPEVHPGSSEFKGIGPFRVLVADDAPENRRLVSFYLRGTGAEATFVEDGEKALEQVMMHPFDVVLMDMQMPVMDGYTATRAIRAWEEGNGITPVPIVGLTALAFESDARRCLDAGCTEYLSKPVALKVLQKTVARLVAEGKGPRGVALQEGGGEAGAEGRTDVPPELAAFVPDYLRDRRGEVLLLAGALERSDFDAIRGCGHRMRGSGSSYGFPGITEIGGAIEQAAIDRNSESVGKWLNELSAYLESVGA